MAPVLFRETNYDTLLERAADLVIAKQKLLFERNIILIDLESIWSDKNVSDRLSSFFDLLREEVEKKEKQDQWFDWNMAVRFSSNTDIGHRTHLLQQIRNMYPGWIFLPWDIKKKVSHVLDRLDFLHGFEKLSFKEQLDYMYEHVKFFDMGGRPLQPQ